MTNRIVPASRQLVFVGGLHRSGTTLLAELLGAHPEVSSLAGTGVWHDEGQFLQSVMPTASECGGPGKFAFCPAAHLTELDSRPPDAARQIVTSWLPYWDLDRHRLVEKSPPNLLRFRYLQALFPDASFVAIVRHPVAVSYATQAWAQRSISRLLAHWLRAHELFEQDRTYLRRLTLVRYEDLVRDVAGTLADVFRAIEVEPFVPDADVRSTTNDRYLKRFRHSRISPVAPRVAANRLRFERRLRRLGYGYRLDDGP